MSESKIILTGNFGVGKSSIFNRLVNGIFEEKYLTTISVKVGQKEIQAQKYVIWDVAGEVSQEKIPPTYFLNAAHILYVIDLSRPNTFPNIGKDLDFLQLKYPNCELHTIGNKIDLLSSPQEIDLRIAALPCACKLLTSAKTGEGIEGLSSLLIK